MKQYDVIFVGGELYFDHPMCGQAVLKRLLEKHGYTVGLIAKPLKAKDVTELGKPKLFFAVTSGAIDSMMRNYTPLKKLRQDDKNQDYNEEVPDRAVTVYCNWIRENYKDSIMVLGGTEASLRRFSHYDYISNKLRRPILFDSRADILAYGFGEKQMVEIANRIKNKKDLENIEGTCIITKTLPKKVVEVPSWDEINGEDIESKKKFCEMHNKISIKYNVIQKIDNRYLLQYREPEYTSKDLDEIYELPFTRKLTHKHLDGFMFSVVTHRGCLGDCNFCAITFMAGDKVISRSKESIIREITRIAKMPYFKGNIDDLGGPTANMYGMDCEYRHNCNKKCLSCKLLNKSQDKWLDLLRAARSVPGVKKVYIRSGMRYDMLDTNRLKEVLDNHVFETLRIAPEHTSKVVLKAMNKDYGNLQEFISKVKNITKNNERKIGLSYYFMTGHPGSSMKEAKELRKDIEKLENAETVQMFTPSPMTTSTAMYWTGMDPKTLKPIYVPYTYNEKKEQKRVLFEGNKNMKGYVSLEETRNNSNSKYRGINKKYKYNSNPRENSQRVNNIQRDDRRASGRSRYEKRDSKGNIISGRSRSNRGGSRRNRSRENRSQNSK